MDRALPAGAPALGGRVESETLPGYMPLRCDPLMGERFRAIAADRREAYDGAPAD